ncbi:MAG: hypothetical protein F4X64_00245 [Chloroflexi bacterium]|nr:hypothetical protein [Chloroflexota bacterium]
MIWRPLWRRRSITAGLFATPRVWLATASGERQFIISELGASGISKTWRPSIPFTGTGPGLLPSL